MKLDLNTYTFYIEQEVKKYFDKCSVPIKNAPNINIRRILGGNFDIKKFLYDNNFDLEKISKDEGFKRAYLESIVTSLVFDAKSHIQESFDEEEMIYMDNDERSVNVIRDFNDSYFISEFYEKYLKDMPIEIDKDYFDKILDDLNYNVVFFPYQNKAKSNIDEIVSLIKGCFNRKNSVDDFKIAFEKNEMLQKLFESQGYKPEDVFDILKIKKSKFLKSFLEEFYSIEIRYDNPDNKIGFAFRMNFDDYKNLFIDIPENGTSKNITIEPNNNTDLHLRFGIFDYAYKTCNSNMEIVLEKPFSFEVDKNFFAYVDDKERLMFYGSPFKKLVKENDLERDKNKNCADIMR